TNRILDQEPLLERAAVVRADGADREPLAAAAGEEHGFVAGVSEQHGAVGDGRSRDSPGEIGAGKFWLLFAHWISFARLDHSSPGRRTQAVGQSDKRKVMVEAAGIEPASVSPTQSGLHA